MSLVTAMLVYHSLRPMTRPSVYSFSEISLDHPKSKQTDLALPGFHRVRKYLADRGVPEELIDPLGIQIIPARELIPRARGTASPFEDSRLACVFPHRDASGKAIDWWSARLIDVDERPIVAAGFQAMVEARKWGKMFCPPNEPPHAYLAPNLDWSLLKRGDNVYIHESCIKAINGAILGYWSVGLNGVWGFTSRKHNIALAEELRGLPWKALELTPVIVFDSNAADNWDVRGAITSLAGRIHAVTGRRARHLILPKNGDAHWGFDDFCVNLGAEEARGYLDRAAQAPEVEVSPLELLKIRLNSEVCIVRSLGRVVEQETGTLMSRATFTDVNYATYVAVSDDDKPISVARAWLMDERRTEVERLEYVPGGALVVEGQYLNLWRGMGCEPKEGGVRPWEILLEKQIPLEWLRKWLVQWMAYPLQNLGGKMNTFVHLYGPPGSGKNGLLSPLLRIYGRNGVVIGKEQISSSFNSIYTARQFINLDELHGGSESGALVITNKVKMLVTGEMLTVNTKGQPEYEVRNHCNLVTTSNYSDSIKLDEGDRRACVIQFGTRETMLSQLFWDEYFAWIDNGGAEALYFHLMRVDLTGFEPGANAPATEWKEMVTDATRDAMEKWVRELWDDPDSVLPPIMRSASVLTPEQLGAAYYPGEPTKNTPGLRNALGQRMNDMGFVRSQQVKIDGAPKRFWIIRDKDGEWSNERIREAAMIGVKAKF